MPTRENGVSVKIKEIKGGSLVGDLRLTLFRLVVFSGRGLTALRKTAAAGRI